MLFLVLGRTVYLLSALFLQFGHGACYSFLCISQVCTLPQLQYQLFHNMALYLCIITIAKKLQFNFSHCCNVLSYFCLSLASLSGEHQTWGFLWRPGWLSPLQVQDRFMEHCGMSFASRWPLLYCPTYSYDLFFCLSSNAGLLYH